MNYSTGQQSCQSMILLEIKFDELMTQKGNNQTYRFWLPFNQTEN